MNYFILLLLAAAWSCSPRQATDYGASQTLDFYPPSQVTVAGYNGGDLMEPFLSRNGHFLFFNNLNAPTVNTDIFYAVRVNDTLFQFQGPVQGANSTALDAVPSMDNTGNFYFVSTRSYSQTFSTLYHGLFSNGAVTGVTLVPGISRQQPGIVNFDAEVSADGNTLYFVDGAFSSGGQLLSADLVMAARQPDTAAGFQRLSDGPRLLAAINTADLEYAACTSGDELTLYFTHAVAGSTSTTPRIYYATRESKAAPFHKPNLLLQADGFVEAATVAGDSLVYYHKKEADGFKLYCVRRK